jgi:hypothetical protein
MYALAETEPFHRNRDAGDYHTRFVQRKPSDLQSMHTVLLLICFVYFLFIFISFIVCLMDVLPVTGRLALASQSRELPRSCSSHSTQGEGSRRLLSHGRR